MQVSKKKATSFAHRRIHRAVSSAAKRREQLSKVSTLQSMTQRRSPVKTAAFSASPACCAACRASHAMTSCRPPSSRKKAPCSNRWRKSSTSVDDARRVHRRGGCAGCRATAVRAQRQRTARIVVLQAGPLPRRGQAVKRRQQGNSPLGARGGFYSIRAAILERFGRPHSPAKRRGIFGFGHARRQPHRLTHRAPTRAQVLRHRSQT